jgi:hypothetical protein
MIIINTFEPLDFFVMNKEDICVEKKVLLFSNGNGMKMNLIIKIESKTS